MHLKLKEYDKAKEMYEKGLVIYKELKDQSGETACLEGLKACSAGK